MERNIKVSIVCNTYNQKAYISQAIESFLAQKTTFDFEIIIHDDASTDGTQNIVKSYALDYPDIIVPVLETENQYSKGRDTTINTVMNFANGKYIAFCEGDDYWICKQKLQLQYDWLEEHPDCSLVVGQAIRVDKNGEFIKKYSNYFENNSFDMVFKDVIENMGSFPFASMLLRRSFYENNYLFLKRFVCFDYFLKCLLATEGVVHCLKETIAAYRENSFGSWSVTVRDNKQKFEEHLKYSIILFKEINKYTKFRYKKEIEQEILKREMEILKINRSINIFTNKKYRDLFLNKTLKERFIFLLSFFSPSLSKILRKIYLLFIFKKR